MGRKSGMKGSFKERRQKWKEESERIAQAQKRVAEANKMTDPFQELSMGAFQKFDRNDISINIEAKRVADLDEETLQWCIDLTKVNMQDIYEMSEGGWSDRAKREEMTHESVWYLIARNQQGQRKALVHFRFDMDYEVEVVYCYEIQLVKEVQKKGLGKFLMQILELFAFKTGMKKVMCTVFSHNTGSMAFFKKIKYVVDETQPDPLMDGEVDYEILSKPIKPAPPARMPTATRAADAVPTLVPAAS
ncbi:PREDICTED: N-alpha-acetyltransferase 40-like [Priapulus caudatus]|uniref:N-alpha-acetyltransferase 40 n=1 Tax=Priapulus caudatus TaxID=37621 RepID=A0ABM1DTP9_PRICU|nr:PREDICTED: N-alpha-acetyltransferase 40-like [Priapulus caudatus]XP_014663321.1 PREDICTED: N-alpha-acetyltransferase 40-like [Priapulus caudatus]